MQIRTLNFNKYNRKYDIKEVTNFNLEGLGTLFDSSIFGYGDERLERCGYINLVGYFIDPSIFDISRRLFRELSGIVDGTRYYKIEKDGTLSLSDEQEGSTGLNWFYENFDKIKFNRLEEVENNKIQTRKMKGAFTRLKREDFFIRNLIVIPLHYRDLDTSQGNNSIKVDELNQLYIDLIKTTSFKKKMSNIESMNDSFINTKIQGLLQSIYDYICNTLFGKEGAQRHLAMGRSVDNCSRVVITAPEVKLNDTIGKCTQNLDNINVPLHHFLSGTPTHAITATHMILKSFLERGLLGNIDNEDFETFYTDDWIQEQIETYTVTYSHRLDTVPTPESKSIKLRFLFKDEDSGVESDSERELTFIDLFYLSSKLYIHGIRGAVTRYPIIGKDSMLFGKILLSSFHKNIGNMKIFIPGEELPIYDYDKYPNAEPFIGKLSTDIFADTMQFSNTYLSGLDGDYDGDKVSLKYIYSKEAVEEIDKYNDTPISVLSIDGKPTRSISNEALQGIYNLTKMEKNAKPLNDKLNNILKDTFNKEDYILNDILQLINEWGSSHLVNWKGNNKTTLGRVIFNEVLFNHLDNFPFINKDVNKSVLGDIQSDIVALLLKKIITVNDYRHFVNKLDQLGFGVCTLTGSSLSYSLLVKDDLEFTNKRNELMDKYKEGIDKGDVLAMTSFENELIEWSKQHYSDDEMVDMFNSGAKAGWGNNFKNLKVSVGAAPSTTGEINLIKSNLKDGLTNEEVIHNTNMQIFGAGGRALQTQQGGYRVKQFQSAFQSTIGRRKDCGSTQYNNIVENNRSDLIGRYIKGPSGDILITEENVKDYLNKPIEMRSPMFCKSKDVLCSHCLGETIFELMDSDEVNIGFFVSIIGSRLLGASMKSTHDMTQKMTSIEKINDYIVSD